MQLLDTITMTSTPVALDVHHDKILWHLRDAKRVTPTHGAHPTPSIASPLAYHLPEPWVFCASNETCYPENFEALYLGILPQAHPPGASIDVMGIHPVVTDLFIHNKSFLLKYLTPSKKIYVFLFKKHKTNEIYLKFFFIPMSP
jgi:hypothetical protein